MSATRVTLAGPTLRAPREADPQKIGETRGLALHRHLRRVDPCLLHLLQAGAGPPQLHRWGRLRRPHRPRSVPRDHPRRRQHRHGRRAVSRSCGGRARAIALGYVAARVLEAAIIGVGILSLLAVVTLRQDVGGAGGDSLVLVGTVARRDPRLDVPARARLGRGSGERPDPGVSDVPIRPRAAWSGDAGADRGSADHPLGHPRAVRCLRCRLHGARSSRRSRSSSGSCRSASTSSSRASGRLRSWRTSQGDPGNDGIGGVDRRFQPRPGGYHITRGGTCNRNAEPAWGWNREPLPGSDAQAARHPVAPRWTPGSDRWCHGRNPGRTPLLRSLSGRPYVDPCIGGLWFGCRHAGGRLLEP